MTETEWLAERFEADRTHLQAVAFQMLGSLSEADDAVQEAWLRLNRADTSGVENLGGWLTTVVARVCFDMLRSRRARREESLGAHVPEPIANRKGETDPEREAILADSVGLALLVVLERLAPAERLAFVLHDIFAVSFDEIAQVVGRTPTAARQLASRARRRVRGAPKANLASQRAVVDTFLTAWRNGDFGALVAVLDPEVVVRADVGAGGVKTPSEIRGAQTWAKQAMVFSRGALAARPALVNGELGVVVAPRGRLVRVLSFSIAGGKIVAIEVIGDPLRFGGLDLSLLD